MSDTSGSGATTAIQTYLTVNDAKAAIDFYQRAFDAVEVMHQDHEESGKVIHSTLALFGGHIMLSDEFEGHGEPVKGPKSLGGTSVTIHINLDTPERVDAAMANAEREGATITMPASTMFWGAYYGRLIDPAGHSWSFAAEGGDDAG